MSNEKSNTARINDQFNEVSELTGLVFVSVKPMDTIGTGSGKIEANLKLLVEHLKEPRQYDQMGNLKVNGREFYDRFRQEYNYLSDEPIVGSPKKIAQIFTGRI